MDLTQKFLVIVAIILTGLLVVVGYNVILIIIDIRKAIKKLNQFLDDATLGGGLINPEKLRGIVEIFKKDKK